MDIVYAVHMLASNLCMLPVQLFSKLCFVSCIILKEQQGMVFSSPQGHPWFSLAILMPPRLETLLTDRLLPVPVLIQAILSFSSIVINKLLSLVSLLHLLMLLLRMSSCDDSQLIRGLLKTLLLFFIVAMVVLFKLLTMIFFMRGQNT